MVSPKGVKENTNQIYIKTTIKLWSYIPNIKDRLQGVCKWMKKCLIKFAMKNLLGNLTYAEFRSLKLLDNPDEILEKFNQSSIKFWTAMQKLHKIW